jgi:glycosyltransferase A (GT-A) superfamily protein (DUF2064 family)
LRPETNHTALLLFSRSAPQEAAHKPYFGKHRKKAGYQLAAGLIAHTRQLCRQSGLSFLQVDEHGQWGDSFGERLSNAVQQVWSKGYQRVLVIGNDCPGLTAAHLQQAAAALERQDWVLGPTTGGGVYLIGMTAAAFHPQAFEQISWQSDSVFTELASLSTGSTAGYAILPILGDVNTAGDWFFQAKQLVLTQTWVRKLINYLAPRRYISLYTTSLTSTFPLFIPSRRGPPQPLL